MDVKRVIGYGDSWTEGVGFDPSVEQTPDDTMPGDWLVTERKKHSWVRWLADEYHCEWINNGVSGGSTRKAYERLMGDAKAGDIKKDDVVVFMHSSPIRDPLYFFPNIGKPIGHNEQYVDVMYLGYSLKHFIEDNPLNKSPMWWVSTENDKFNTGIDKFKRKFITSLVDYAWYDYMTFNMSLLIQYTLTEIGCKFIICDSFEKAIGDNNEIVNKNINLLTSYIRDFTMSEYVLSIDPHNFDLESTNEYIKHPNIKGYQIIADCLYKKLENDNR
jgi:hypothetical protein